MFSSKLLAYLVRNMICDVGVVRVKAFASRAAGSGFDSRLLPGFFRVESHQ